MMEKPTLSENCRNSSNAKLKDPKLWKNNETCPVCGFPADPRIFSCETGYDYCSDECAKQHVKALEPEGGW